MNVSIKKGQLNGHIYAPPSKSYAHRLLIASFLSKKECIIKNIYLSNDVLATINCLKQLGAIISFHEKDLFISYKKSNEKMFLLNADESGSTLRFLIPVALLFTDNVTFKGSERLISRGIRIYEELFKKHNIKIIKTNTTLTFQGKINSGEFIIDGSESSQYITGLLFTLPLLNNDSIIKIIPPLLSKSYIDITLDVLKMFKIEYKIVDNNIYIKGNQTYNAINSEVEADYSNAAFLEAFNYFNNNVSIDNLNDNSHQGDKIYQKYFKLLFNANCKLDISNCIDLGPVLFAFAALHHGATFIGTKRLKIKESDRANAMKDELKKVNCDVSVLDDEVVVNKITDYNIKEQIIFDSHNDHRIAMAESLFLCKYNIKINNAEAVKKSYPHYFEELKRLGVDVIYE